MRLLIHYKGITKILPQVTTYAAIVKFVNETFFLKLSKWTITYVDSDGDKISLDSQLDVQAMLENDKKHLKAYIEDQILPQNSSKVQESNSDSKHFLEDTKGGDEIVEKSDEDKKEPEVVAKVDEVPSEKFEPLPKRKKICNQWKKQWEVKVEQKMSKFVDERIEMLLPCITKKVESKIHANEFESKKIESEIQHQVKCIGCGVEPIQGIRYKCLKCSNFNFCQNCQETIEHNHNMLKMKFVEEEGQQKEKQKDETLKITRKCFRMSETFGGDAQSYRDFVTANKDLKFTQISELYIKENEKASLSSKIEEKIDKKCQKLSFYFNEPKENFREIAKKNPAMNFKELIKVVKTELNEESQVQKVEQKVEIKKSVPQIDIMKRNKCLLELKELFGDENMYNYLKFIDLNYDLSQEEIIAKYKFIKSEEESKIKKIDIIKRNKCILKMKEYFGDANMYNYLKFFDEHYDLSEEEIIAKYIENYHQFVEKKEVKMQESEPSKKLKKFIEIMGEMFGERDTEKLKLFFKKYEREELDALVEIYLEYAFK